MTKFFTLVFSLCLMVVAGVNAQITTPAASTSATLTQTVGLTDITVEYSRPGVKGRTIFAADGLVPFGETWRTGANAATKISFSKDVTVEGAELTAGSYAILTVPGASSWMVKFYNYEGGNWGSYNDKTPAATVSVTAQEIPFTIQNFLIVIGGEITDNSATLEIIWDKTLVPIKIGVNTEAQVLASIESTMAGPSENDYYNAGSYYSNSGKNLDKALEYVQKVTHGETQRFWQLRVESEILAKLGKYKDAIAVATKSKELATEAGNNDYVKINTDNIASWGMK